MYPCLLLVFFVYLFGQIKPNRPRALKKLYLYLRQYFFFLCIQNIREGEWQRGAWQAVWCSLVDYWLPGGAKVPGSDSKTWGWVISRQLQAVAVAASTGLDSRSSRVFGTFQFGPKLISKPFCPFCPRLPLPVPVPIPVPTTGPSDPCPWGSSYNLVKDKTSLCLQNRTWCQWANIRSVNGCWLLPAAVRVFWPNHFWGVPTEIGIGICIRTGTGSGSRTATTTATGNWEAGSWKLGQNCVCCIFTPGENRKMW